MLESLGAGVVRGSVEGFSGYDVVDAKVEEGLRSQEVCSAAEQTITDSSSAKHAKVFGISFGIVFKQWPLASRLAASTP